MDIARFKKLPIMGIVRGIGEESIAPLVEAAISGGLETLEIAMNTENAESLIAKTVALAGHRLMIGAGTVLSVESLKCALDAGATFIVMPAIVDEVLEYCAKHSQEMDKKVMEGHISIEIYGFLAQEPHFRRFEGKV